MGTSAVRVAHLPDRHSILPWSTWIVSDPSYEEVASDGSYGLFERKQ